MVDWSKLLLPATFRGVPFRVETEGADFGRRVAVHDIVGGESPVTEDMGAQARRWPVTAYVAGSLATAQALLLMSALNQAGPGLLLLPWQGPAMARVERAAPSREKDRAGYIAFDITFVAAGGPGLFGVLPAISVLGAKALTGIVIVAALATAVMSRSSGRSDHEVAAAATGAATLEALRGEAGITGDTDDEIAGTIVDLAAMDFPGDPEGWLTAAGEIARTLAREAEGDTAATFRAYAAAADTSTSTGLAMAGFLGAAAAMVTAGADYACRQDAVAARAALADMAEAAREALYGLGDAAGDWYGDLIGTALRRISEDAADLSPLVRVETGQSLPSTLVAWKLYGDPSRAAELIDRNRAATAAFLPAVLTAVAPD